MIGHMTLTGPSNRPLNTGLKFFHDSIPLRTKEGSQFIDLTDRVIALVEQSGVQNGLVNVQTRHTTTAVIVNEHEPLLLEDLKRTLERIAPRDGAYQHNDFTIRTHNMTPDAKPNDRTARSRRFQQQ